MSDQLLQDAAAVLQPGFVNDGPGRAPDWVRRAIADDGLAGVAYYGRNIGEKLSQTAELSAALKAENPELLIAVDEEGGDVTRLDVVAGSAYPGNYALGYVDDVDLTAAVAREIGLLLAGGGINLDYAPDADVNTNPDNPVIGTRAFGADPRVVARHTAAYVRGLQSSGVAGCAKHFPGHGDTAMDSHHGLPRVDHTEEGWAAHLAPFRAAVEAGVKAVMTAHILAPPYDGDAPSTMSRRVLVDLLRGELGFGGLVVTDGIEMGAIADTYGVPEGTVLAIAAGADAVCVGGGLRDEIDYLTLRDALIAAVKEGRLPEERLHDAAERVRELGAWTRQRSHVQEGTDAAGNIGAGGGGAAGIAGGGERGGDPIGLIAARRAIEVVGAPLAPLAGPATVLEFSPAANNAAGAAVPWGLGPVLDRLPVGSTVLRFGRPGDVTDFAGDAAALPDSDVDLDSTPAAERPSQDAVPYTPSAVGEAAAAASGRPLILVVRDAHRHPWMGEALRAAATVRPDAIVVETGVAYGLTEKSVGATLIASHGAARVCGLAVAEVLVAGSGDGAS